MVGTVGSRFTRSDLLITLSQPQGISSIRFRFITGASLSTKGVTDNW